MTESDIEIQLRCAKPDELEEVLQVMCSAFGLSFEKAKKIFFSDPFLNHSNNLVLMTNGQVTSCLTLLPIEVMIGGSVVRIGGIAGLATKPDQQRKGYAARLLKYALDVCKERDLPLVILEPSNIKYYLKLGWIETSRSVCYGIRGDLQLHEPVGMVVREIMPDDILMMDTIRSARMNHSLARIRDAVLWSQIIKRYPNSKVLVNQFGEVEGYVLVEIILGQINWDKASTSPRFVIIELYALYNEAARTLLASILNFGIEQVEIAGEEYEIKDLGVNLQKVLCSLNIPPAFGRLVSFRGMVIALLSNLPEIPSPVKLECRYEDFSEVITVGNDGEGRLKIIGELTTGTTHLITGNEEAWLMTLSGYYSAKAALSVDLLAANSMYAAQTVMSLFPARHPHLAVADRF